MISGTDLTLALTALGVLAAVVIPVGIWHFTREARFRLDILLEKQVFLVSQVTRDLDYIRILIDDEPAPEQVVWITGWIINSGKLDISSRNIEKRLRLNLPDDMSWLRATIDRSSPDVECSSAIVDKSHIEFSWTLLRSGEYIHYDCLIQCPAEKTAEVWDLDSLASAIRPYSRIENTRTDAVVPISPQLLRDDSTQLKRRLTRKIIITATLAIIYPTLWALTFFPYELDSIFGDGFLRASPSVARIVDGNSHELLVSMDRLGNVKLELDEPLVELFYGEDEHSKIFESDDIEVGQISVGDMSKNTVLVTMISCFTFLVLIGCIFMWLPTRYFVGSRKRHAVSALRALRKGG